MNTSLTPAQIGSLKDRFGAVLDVDEEIRAATDYALNFHRGRPYKNFGRFVLNWCIRAANDPRLRQRRYQPAPRPVPAPPSSPVTREQLAAIAADPAESDQAREQALELLRAMAAE